MRRAFLASLTILLIGLGVSACSPCSDLIFWNSGKACGARPAQK